MVVACAWWKYGVHVTRVSCVLVTPRLTDVSGYAEKERSIVSSTTTGTVAERVKFQSTCTVVAVSVIDVQLAPALMYI